MQHRAVLVALTVILLLGRVACAWGWGWSADPCCKDERGLVAQVVLHPGASPACCGESALQESDLHCGDAELPPGSEAGHAQHAGHCHCVFQVDAEVAVTTPAVEAAVWPLHPQVAPEVDPGAIDWPPEARS